MVGYVWQILRREGAFLAYPHPWEKAPFWIGLTLLLLDYMAISLIKNNKVFSCVHNKLPPKTKVISSFMKFLNIVFGVSEASLIVGLS